MLNEDYRDILRILSEKGARYLVVGAYAMSVHGYPRATGDIDIWVERSHDNSRRVFDAIAAFGAPAHDISPDTFTETDVVFQIGVAPRRVDILTHADGLDFEEAFRSREVLELEGLIIPFISRADLLTKKRATGREKDRLDARMLSGESERS
jgi:hypothetical protein